jgi:hypothetical protein
LTNKDENILEPKRFLNQTEVTSSHVVLRNKHTKPYRFESAEIALTDPNKNKIKSFGIPQFTIGFYQASLTRQWPAKGKFMFD